MDVEYLKLVERFPLLEIVSQKEHDEGVLLLAELVMNEPLSEIQRRYGHVLNMLLLEWEKKSLALVLDDCTGPEILAYVQEQNGFTGQQLADIAGVSKTQIYDYLNSRKSLSRMAREKLGSYFLLGVDVLEFSPVKPTGAFRYAKPMDVDLVVRESGAAAKASGVSKLTLARKAARKQKQSK
jgi:hypothetical protein